MTSLVGAHVWAFAVWGETILRLYEVEKIEEEANSEASLEPNMVAD